MTINNLLKWNDQKYKTENEMREEYPTILQEFQQGSFPPDILDQLQTLLIKIGKQPLIVRSSSLLEDNFGTSFAGKYDSIFCPNQGNLEKNLQQLTPLSRTFTLRFLIPTRCFTAAARVCWIMTSAWRCSFNW